MAAYLIYFVIFCGPVWVLDGDLELLLLRFYDPVNTYKGMSSQTVNLLTLFANQA